MALPRFFQFDALELAPKRASSDSESFSLRKTSLHMNWSRMPPLSALRAFAAYATSRSVTEAGAALNVSHAAISQQLRALEAHLGIALLDRSGRQLHLTPAGAQLAQALTDGFGTIAAAVEALTGAESERPLQVGCTPSFAATWLMPRLAGFSAAHPEIETMILPSPQLTDPAAGGIDVAIRYGTGPWPGLLSDPLLPAPLVVAAAPHLVPDAPSIDAADLLNLPWLQELGTNETSRWLAARGVVQSHRTRVTHVPGNLMIDGLRDGIGIAVTTRLAIASDLAAGRLVALFEDDTDSGYHLVTRPGVPRPPLRAFLAWVRKTARKAE